MQDTPRNSPRSCRDGSGGSEGVTAKVAPPCPSPPRRGCHSGSGAGCHSCLSPPCRLSGTRRRWLSPSARLVSPFPALLLAQLIPSSAAIDFGISCAARSRSPDLCRSGEGKHGAVGRRVAFPGSATASGSGVWLLGTPREAGMGWVTGRSLHGAAQRVPAALFPAEFHSCP